MRSAALSLPCLHSPNAPFCPGQAGKAPQRCCPVCIKMNLHRVCAASNVYLLPVFLLSITTRCCRELARRRGIPTQEFCVKSDMACGSTIGPILSSGLGCRTVDVGGPQLSMHSIREMCGTKVGVALIHDA